MPTEVALYIFFDLPAIGHNNPSQMAICVIQYCIFCDIIKLALLCIVIYFIDIYSKYCYIYLCFTINFFSLKNIVREFSLPYGCTRGCLFKGA